MECETKPDNHLEYERDVESETDLEYEQQGESSSREQQRAAESSRSSSSSDEQIVRYNSSHKPAGISGSDEQEVVATNK